MSSKLIKLLDQLTKLHPKYIDLSLGRLNKLLDKLGNPHLLLPPTIHIAGTNGRGSTLSFVKQILIEHNFKVHCYISPHLEKIEERFVLANKIIKREKLVKSINFVKKINNNNPITFFEIITATAFYLFNKSYADFLILETGLGGRLDATNVIKKSIIDIITPISFDHKEFLGNNLKKISNEKLGIIKKSSIIIIGKQHKDILIHIKKKIINKKNKKIFYKKNYIVKKLEKNYFIMNYNNKLLKFKNPNLLGQHQIENASTAIAAIFNIKNLGYSIKKNLINKGLINTKWAGRLEKGYLYKIPVFIDGAHNIAGSKQLVNFFKNKELNRWLIIGMLNNKELENYLLQIKNIISGVVAIKIPDEENTFTPDEIMKICKKINITCFKKRNIKEANKFLSNKIKPEQIIISGSLYLVGKVRKLYV